MLHWLRATRNEAETRKMYLDHLDSVRMSGLGFPNYRSAIMGSMQVELGLLPDNVVEYYLPDYDL